MDSVKGAFSRKEAQEIAALGERSGRRVGRCLATESGSPAELKHPVWGLVVSACVFTCCSGVEGRKGFEPAWTKLCL